jgi:hypothetical protein
MCNFSKIRCLTWGIGALQVFIGFTAIAGGYQLLSRPMGTPAMPIEMLHASPFTTFFIPGIVLLVFIGAVNVLSLVVTINGGRHRGSAAFAGGGILIGYMTAEVWWIGWQNALQPLYLVLSLILLLSGLALRRMLHGATVSTDAGILTYSSQKSRLPA